ncbi:hypothetical protein J4E86_000567 [Alternaria arbusti]|uniref:uncharacterized protein n=1 Tax=Alternaria arbusti TaxID=232088 RepID=UPI00221F0E25|nr:uncharacterized protein J4E86_000567 [Alternaria arbusti]KAI4961539.1 hypothetical protein J4E86_000567 [Alternaria arbusti]
MVIKEAKAFTPSRWRDPKNWRDRLPQEIRIHQLLEERRAVDPAMCRHIIRCRAHRLWMEHRRYRLYLDYHSGGDMNAAMTFHAKNWEDGKPIDEDIFAPEGFVWYTIKALATACLVLREGTIDGTTVNGWRPITHLDLQLPNVLLDVHTPPTQEAKGKSKAGSSKSARLNRADADNWRAKEPPVMPILADFALRRKRNIPPNNATSVLAEQSIAQCTAGKYGREVKELVRRCLNFDHNFRPTLKEILAEVDQYFSEDEVLTEQIRDQDGLQLILPDTPEFAIGQPVDAAKRRGRE